MDNTGLIQGTKDTIYYQMDKTEQAESDFQTACDHENWHGTKWAMKNAICK